MNLNLTSLLFFSLIVVASFSVNFAPPSAIQNSEKEELVNKRLRDLLTKMNYIEGDTFVMGYTSFFGTRMTEADATLLTGIVPRRTAVGSYYISATEVTNGEWRAFYLTKVADLGALEGKRKFYPDTSLWVSEFPYSYNAPMAKNYFSNPAFNDYPVVGITWEQANAYCRWKSKKLKSLLKKAGIQQAPEFRLPTEAEWEYAAIKKVEATKHAKRSAYIWEEDNQISRLNSLANTGQILDINQVVLKSYAEDGCLYTCKVASYPPNENGLYNMAGNVSEWTSDPAYAESRGLKDNQYKTISSVNELDQEVALIKNDSEFKDADLKQFVLEHLAHNRKVLSASDTKICKGGSWANGMIYTQPGSRQGVSKDQASTKIGFRLVVDVNEELRKYFPKKPWQPQRQ